MKLLHTRIFQYEKAIVTPCEKTDRTDSTLLNVQFTHPCRAEFIKHQYMRNFMPPAELFDLVTYYFQLELI